MNRRSFFSKAFSAAAALVLARFAKPEAIAYDCDFPVITDYEQDPEYLSLITTTYQIVRAYQIVWPEPEPGVHVRYRRIDNNLAWKIVKKWHLPEEYPELKFGAFTRPYLNDSLA